MMIQVISNNHSNELINFLSFFKCALQWGYEITINTYFMNDDDRDEWITTFFKTPEFIDTYKKKISNSSSENALFVDTDILWILLVRCNKQVPSSVRNIVALKKAINTWIKDQPTKMLYLGFYNESSSLPSAKSIEEFFKLLGWNALISEQPTVMIKNLILKSMFELEISEHLLEKHFFKAVPQLRLAFKKNNISAEVVNQIKSFVFSKFININPNIFIDLYVNYHDGSLLSHKITKIGQVEGIATDKIAWSNFYSLFIEKELVYMKNTLSKIDNEHKIAELNKLLELAIKRGHFAEAKEHIEKIIMLGDRIPDYDVTEWKKLEEFILSQQPKPEQPPPPQ